VFAITFSAFTKPSTTSKLFVFKGTIFTVADVENEANWELETVGCEHQANQRACSFEIEIPAGQEANFYNTSTNKLKSESGSIGVSVDATQLSGDPANSYVIDVLKSNSSLVNQIDNIAKP